MASFLVQRLNIETCIIVQVRNESNIKFCESVAASLIDSIKLFCKKGNLQPANNFNSQRAWLQQRTGIRIKSFFTFTDYFQLVSITCCRFCSAADARFFTKRRILPHSTNPCLHLFVNQRSDSVLKWEVHLNAKLSFFWHCWGKP